MDHLREGIYLRGYGQKDPKQEYKKEGYNIFTAMMNGIGTDIVRMMYHVQIRREEGDQAAQELERRQQQQAARQRLVAQHADVAPATGDTVNQPPQQAAAQASRPMPPSTPAAPQAPVRRNVPKIGRNDPCYCGSGKKYKKCHLPEDEAAGIAPPP